MTLRRRVARLQNISFTVCQSFLNCDMLSTLSLQKILPAVTFLSPQHVLPVTEAMMRGGLRIMEVTLRTDVAMASIRTIKSKIAEMMIGAGTILTVDQLHEAIDAGAEFGLSPSLNLNVVKEANRLNFPFIPGVMTPSEIYTAYENGCTLLKIFPVSSIGGISFLKSVQSPYAHLQLRYVPMGGINPGNMKDYLELKNVIAVGGSWLAPEELMKKGDYAGIEKITRESLLASKAGAV